MARRIGEAELMDYETVDVSLLFDMHTSTRSAGAPNRRQSGIIGAGSPPASGDFMITTDNTNPHSYLNVQSMGKERDLSESTSTQTNTLPVEIMSVWIEQIGERERTWQCL